LTCTVKDRTTAIASQPPPTRAETVHYHLVDSTRAGQVGYHEEIFGSSGEALAAARDRAVWLADLSGWRVHSVTSRDGFLITSGRAHEAGRMIEVQECDDPECLEAAYGPMC
jgi:hypothetical protein